MHWPRFLFLWLPAEAILLATTIILVNDPNGHPMPIVGLEQSCKELSYTCGLPTGALVLAITFTAFIVIYFLYYTYTVYRVFLIFYGLPYNQFRMGNLVIRLQVRLRGMAFAFFVLASLCFFYIQFNSCDSFILIFFGLMPVQFVMTVVAVANSILATPKRPEETAILQVWLQGKSKKYQSADMYLASWREETLKRNSRPMHGNSLSTPIVSYFPSLTLQSLLGRRRTFLPSVKSACPPCLPAPSRTSAWTASPCSASKRP